MSAYVEKSYDLDIVNHYKWLKSVIGTVIAFLTINRIPVQGSSFDDL